MGFVVLVCFAAAAFLFVKAARQMKQEATAANAPTRKPMSAATKVGLTFGGVIAVIAVVQGMNGVSPSPQSTQAATQAPQQSRPFDCSTITPERRATYLELKRRLAQGGLTNSEYYAAKEAVSDFEIELSAC